mmetsp:Transcript_13459/g.32496  ORF Transcript_13459/g.32496 Transcript_13459/m.32496 type:complete len:257 (-) Transcript_13459:333-1103(-)
MVHAPLFHAPDLNVRSPRVSFGQERVVLRDGCSKSLHLKLQLQRQSLQRPLLVLLILGPALRRRGSVAQLPNIFHVGNGDKSQELERILHRRLHDLQGTCIHQTFWRAPQNAMARECSYPKKVFRALFLGVLLRIIKHGLRSHEIGRKQDLLLLVVNIVRGQAERDLKSHPQRAIHKPKLAKYLLNSLRATSVGHGHLFSSFDLSCRNSNRVVALFLQLQARWLVVVDHIHQRDHHRLPVPLAVGVALDGAPRLHE